MTIYKIFKIKFAYVETLICESDGVTGTNRSNTNCFNNMFAIFKINFELQGL
jgi:hypothetical protein